MVHTFMLVIERRRSNSVSRGAMYLKRYLIDTQASVENVHASEMSLSGRSDEASVTMIGTHTDVIKTLLRDSYSNSVLNVINKHYENYNSFEKVRKQVCSYVDTLSGIGVRWRDVFHELDDLDQPRSLVGIQLYITIPEDKVEELLLVDSLMH